MAKKFTITTALPYANGPLHLGHVAGVYIPADIYARYQRAKGEDVVFIGGTDEHGVPISIKAKNEGVVLFNPTFGRALRSLFVPLFAAISIP